jgi:hypothetical protein
MSVPYGLSPAAQQPGPPTATAGPGLGNVLAIATGGLGLVIYLLSFSADVGGYLRTGLVGVLLLGGALLAAASALPKAPATLVPAAVLVVTGTLWLLIDVTNGPAFLGPASEVVTTPGLAVVALVLAFLESAVCVVALLAQAGIVKMTPRPGPYPQPQWGPPPGGYPGGPGPGGYPGQQSVGPPPGGFPQPYTPATAQYGHPGPYSGQSAQYNSQAGQYSGPSGQYSEPGQYSDQPTRISEQPARLSDQPTQYSEQPGGSGQYGGQPGTPPGGFGAPDKS